MLNCIHHTCSLVSEVTVEWTGASTFVSKCPTSSDCVNLPHTLSVINIQSSFNQNPSTQSFACICLKVNGCVWYISESHPLIGSPAVNDYDVVLLLPFEAVNEHLKSHIDTHSVEHNSMKHLQKIVEAYSKSI